MKTLLAMANRDEAKAFKDRKSIDYQMFLTSKWKNNSLLEYDDRLDKKFTSTAKTQSMLDPVQEQNFRENRVSVPVLTHFLVRSMDHLETLQTSALHDGAP